MTDKIALIDGDSLIYYEAFKEQTLEEAVHGIDARLSHMLKEVGATKYIGYLTTTKCFRYKVAKAKDYKSGRVAEKPTLFPGIREHLATKLNFYVVDGLEADDLVVYWNRNMEDSTVICSPDKDVLKQTSGRHYDYRWDKESMGRFVETTPKEAEKFLWKQCLMGELSPKFL